MALRFKLKVLLAMRDMTQKDLAEVTGIRPPTISAIATGKIQLFPVTAIDKICHVLQCQPGDIMEHVEETKQ